jgi:divalent metal cation (Fe/Co/Zn/Cd) transporter
MCGISLRDLQRGMLSKMTELTVAREVMAHRGRRLEYFTTVWSGLEGLIAVAAGIVARTISLVGFGMDRFVEVTSGATLLWRMSVDADVESRERNEKLRLTVVGVCFVVLAVFIAYESVSDLIRKTSPEHSIPGIVLACVSLIVMPILSRAKKKVGNALGSAAMKADARQTDFCVYLSTIVLAGLLLNAVLRSWWADPPIRFTDSFRFARFGPHQDIPNTEQKILTQYIHY